MIGSVFRLFRLFKWKRLLKNSWLFDEKFYLSTYPDVGYTKMDPVLHYLKYGAEEGRNPGPGFNTRFYLEIYPDVEKSQMNALVHYLLFGRAENRHPIPNPLPDPEWPLVFEQCTEPLVSIIIPVYNQFDYTYRCLRSILSHCTTYAYEVIVADDVSRDLTTAIGEYVRNITVIRNERNLGFLLNCNRAAERARGKYILLLNNDTRVMPGWMESLVESAESDDSVGMVGSKLVYPDGRLQEAGGIIWNDASGWNYGRLDDPQKAEYNYVKEADYISGASLMIRHDLWKEIGGFDERYVPAYYEDTDLAFEIRKRGYRVVYQPESEVVHYEGISHGTDTGSGMKRHQVINHEKFYDKWKEVLRAGQFPNAENVFLARDRSRNKPHVLFVDHYLPHYDQDAGSKAAFQYLKILQGSGMQVHFIGDNFWHYPDTPYLEALTQMGIEVLYGNWYFEHWEEWVSDNGKYFDYVILSRPHIAVKYIDIIRRVSGAKIIYFAHDLHFLREERQYRITKDPKHLEESLYWKENEIDLISKADVGYFFSEAEKTVLEAEYGSLNVDVVPLFIYDRFIKPVFDPQHRRDIMFVGGFAHQPNVDAVLWFVEQIWPRVKNELNDVHFYIIGSNPPEPVQALECKDVTITGFISDETLERYYQTCRMVVAPLRFGAGIKGKVVDALYNGVPIVTTSIGAEGLYEAHKYMEIADESEKFALAIIKLYHNEERLKLHSNEGVEYCKHYFSEAYAKKAMSTAFKEFS